MKKPTVHAMKDLVKTYCGLRVDDFRVTDDPSEVTCRTCRKRMYQLTAGR